ncbi:unnamed protein product [Lactuca saligna]|uniref:Uncharacterized protein n=1 Tax=Lactuca saligna TaxID=75948 RepID=A0AA35ZLU2_LACSI|nr:unnamed protein product [Lactuca saligna]
MVMNDDCPIDQHTPTGDESPPKSPATEVNGNKESKVNEPLGTIHKPMHDEALISHNILVVPGIPNEATRSRHETSVSNMDHTPTFGPPKSHNIGPIHNLVPLGCFGPFPNNTTPFSFTSPQAQSNDSDNKDTNSGPKIKKEKGTNLQPSPLINLTKDTT